MSQNIKKSLLGELTYEQVDAVIHEEELGKKGYKFYYIVDADDVKKYTFPLGLYGERKKDDNLDLEFITDEQAAFSEFFARNFNTVLFDEHYEESAMLVLKIKHFKTQNNDIINTTQELIKQIEKNEDNLNGEDQQNVEKKLNFLKDNISLIISITSGLVDDGIQKLFKLIKTKKVIYKSEDLQNFGDKLISYVFENSKMSFDLASELFDHISIASNLHNNFERSTNDQRVSYHRDAKAIARIVEINRELQKANKKIIFLYLSSDIKTSKIFYKTDKKYEQAFKCILENTIVIDNKRVNYQRNSAQLFLQLLCKEKDVQQTMLNLGSIINIVKHKEYLKISQDTSVRLPIDAILKEKIDGFRKKFEDNYTFLRIHKFEFLKNNEPDELLLDSSKKYFEFLNYLIENQYPQENTTKQIIKESMVELSELHFVRNSVTKILDRLIYQGKKGSLVNQIQVGKDEVLGTMHFLPTLFFDKNETLSPRFSEIIFHYKDNTKELSKFITDSVNKLYTNSGTNYEGVLKRCLFLLIISAIQKSRHTEEYFLNHIAETLKKNDMASSDFGSTYFYIYSNVLRRKTNFLEAEKIAQHAILNFPEDPRHFHNLCLAYYCDFEKSKSNQTQLIKKAIDNGNEGIYLYKVLISINKKVLLISEKSIRS